MVKVLVGSRALLRHGYRVKPEDWNFWWDKEIVGTGYHIFRPYEQKLLDLAMTRGGFVVTDFGMAILPSQSVLKAMYLYHYGIQFSSAYEKIKELLKLVNLDAAVLRAMEEARTGLLREVGLLLK